MLKAWYVITLYSGVILTTLILSHRNELVSHNHCYEVKVSGKPSTGAFSGIAGCTPSIASQWQTTAVSSGAFGKGASITYTPTYRTLRKILH